MASIDGDETSHSPIPNLDGAAASRVAGKVKGVKDKAVAAMKPAKKGTKRVQEVLDQQVEDVREEFAARSRASITEERERVREERRERRRSRVEEWLSSSDEAGEGPSQAAEFRLSAELQQPRRSSQGDVKSKRNSKRMSKRLSTLSQLDPIDENEVVARKESPTPAVDESRYPRDFGLDGTCDMDESNRPSATAPESTQKEPIENPANRSKNPAQARLHARLLALRAARHADGPNGRPAKNRTELIEHRRQKQETRKAAKREQRRKERNAQDEAARLRGAPTPGSPLGSMSEALDRARTHTPASPNLSFGRIAFGDGTTLTSTSADPRAQQPSRGKSDPATALAAQEARAGRRSGLDPKKRHEAEERDRWAGAAKRVSGQKVRNDPSLLKKTLKKQLKTKEKSGEAWAARTAGVEKGRVDKQKKREKNLSERKGKKGKKGGKGRPGFEGKRGVF